MKNIFSINVGSKTEPGIISANHIAETMTGGTYVSGIIKYLLLGVLIFGILALIFYFLLERKKTIELQKSEEKFWMNLK